MEKNIEVEIIVPSFNKRLDDDIKKEVYDKLKNYFDISISGKNFKPKFGEEIICEYGDKNYYLKINFVKEKEKIIEVKAVLAGVHYT